ncbi:MAG: hypothetical protein R6V83_11770 [Candidatus Thorarchaeota archaeon]
MAALGYIENEDDVLNEQISEVVREHRRLHGFPQNPTGRIIEIIEVQWQLFCEKEALDLPHEHQFASTSDLA